MLRPILCSAAVVLIAALAGACSSTPPASPPPDQVAPAVVQGTGGPEDYDALLKKYVKGEWVDYHAWKNDAADMERFDAFLRWQADADVKAMPRDDQIAFYVNAYNACNIKNVLEHYPLHSPMDVDGYFDKLKCRVGREDLTVNNIEYDRLIPNYRDMRTHFAIVCSDRGCPPLRAGAYTGATLDSDLEAASRRFVADPRNLKVDPKTGQVEISKLFEWYGKDFTSDPKRPAAKPELYLVQWADADQKRALEAPDCKPKIIEWNWTLNEKR